MEEGVQGKAGKQEAKAWEDGECSGQTPCAQFFHLSVREEAARRWFGASHGEHEAGQPCALLFKKFRRIRESPIFFEIEHKCCILHPHAALQERLSHTHRLFRKLKREEQKLSARISSVPGGAGASMQPLATSIALPVAPPVAPGEHNKSFSRMLFKGRLSRS